MKFLTHLGDLLKEDERFLAEDGQILKSKVYDAAMDMDEKLLGLLISNDTMKNIFFKDVNGTLVFDKVKFSWIVESKEFLPNSYTMYKNKIGLADNKGDLISKKGDVALVWPYKDCVLKGGQDKEDQKRNEIFYNETLAPDEVSRLLYPKVFTNPRRYTENGVEGIAEFDGSDNLIIRGNNLLALSSLLKRYEGKIKCIYIDPPYNTGSDSFGYNDNFNRSTWLVFMKNRLEIAKKLLSNDGVILIQISFHQYPYLRVLADEIFTEDCHQFDMNTLVRHPQRSLTGDKEFNDVVEYTLIYSKSPSFKMPKQEIEKTNDDYQYDIILPDHPDEEIILGGKEVKVYYPNNVIIKRSEGHVGGLKSMSIRGSIREKNSSGRFYVAHLEDKIGIYPEGTIFTVPDMGDDGLPYRIFELPKNGNKNGFYYPGKPQSSNITYKPYPNFIDFVKQYNLVNEEGDVSFRNGKKPEEYIKFYLDIFTEKHDYVLDFFLGSGTTAAVAHKMNRRYIGIEQMDYINTITIHRLQKIIEGEQSGISKAVDWQGGGSFVYCELKELNQAFISQIEEASTSNEVISVLKSATERGFLTPHVVQEDYYSNMEEFTKLSLEEQKQFVMEILDKNKLYVNYCDMDDVDMYVTPEERAFTHSFYGNIRKEEI